MQTQHDVTVSTDGTAWTFCVPWPTLSYRHAYERVDNDDQPVMLCYGVVAISSDYSSEQRVGPGPGSGNGTLT